MNEVLINILGCYCATNLLIMFLIAPILDASMKDEEESFWRTVFIFQYVTYKSSINEINILGIIILEIIVTLCTLVSSVLIFLGMSIVELFLIICDVFCLIFKKR